MALTFYPEGDTVLPGDGELRTLHKIASLAASGGGGGSGGGTLSGSGAPGAGLGSNGDLYVDTTNKDLYAKIGGTWELWLDMV